MRQPVRSTSQSYFWPVLWAVTLHALLFALLFISFSRTPDLPPARPIVQATLYQMKSQSQATSKTQQKIAGEAQKTAAKEYEIEQLEQRKAEEQRLKLAEQKRADDARKAEEKKAAAASKVAEAKAAEQKRAADIAMKKAEDEAKRKAAEDAKKKAAAEAEKKQRAQAAAAEEAKKQAAEVEQARKLEDLKAQALAELLKQDVERQAALADEAGEKAMGNIDDLLRLRAAQGWNRPPSARSGMSVKLRVTMLPDGTITSVSVETHSGDVPYDNSAVAAVRNIGRISEVQSLRPSEYARYRSFTMTFTPEDLAL